jgi:hypothetical protein
MYSEVRILPPLPLTGRLVYERMHIEGEEIPLEELPIAVIEREIAAIESRQQNLHQKITESRNITSRHESDERNASVRLEILIETVERLKEEL